MFNNINLHKLNVVSKFSFSNSQFFVGKTFFHHCSILNSSPGSRPINVSSSSTNIELSDFLFNRVGGSRFSELQVVPYSGFLGPNDGNTDLPIETISSYGESFPWFFDENGRSIDYTKKVSLFDGVKLISNYISKRKNIDQDLISETKLTELLKPFESNPDLTVLELFNHFSSLYDKDKEKIINVVKNFSLASTEGPADPTNVVLGAPTIGREVDPLVTLKPFGTLGDKTINEVAVFLRDLKWDVLLDKTQITLNAAPIAFNFVSFSLILRGYMKYVHNRPFEPGLPVALQTKLRNRQLFSFLIIGAPLVLFSIRKSGLLFKDMVTIQTSLSSPENLSVDNTHLKISPSEGGLFVLISKFSKKIPNSLKTIFRLFLLGLAVGPQIVRV